MTIERVTIVTALALAASLPVSSQTTPAPETVIVKNGALTLRALLWHPAGRGPFPAVLFTHGSGPAADLKRPHLLGSTFVRHGYVFLYLFRRGAGLSADQGTHSGALMSQAAAEKGQEGRNAVQLQLLETELTDVLGGLAYLRGRPEVDVKRIAVGGHSFGGQLALLAAERDPEVRAVVAFGAAARSWEGSPKLQEHLRLAASRTTTPVFFIHAANDVSVAPGNELAAAMTRAGKPGRVKIYPAVGTTETEGHDFVHLGVKIWEDDVFAFLGAGLSKE
jgi:dienelactone hydrolase